LKNTRNNRSVAQADLFAVSRPSRSRQPAVALPAEDNTPEGLQSLLATNACYRESAWPEPFHRTTHRIHLGDARDLGWISDASVHLVVTSPPYWTLKEYVPGNANQMGHFEDYEHFLGQTGSRVA
jgi:modification methylase